MFKLLFQSYQEKEKEERVFIEQRE